MSHDPVAGRQTTVAGWSTSAGQSLLVPVQYSAMSQTSAAGRHTPLDFASSGQEALVPLHVSAMSHGPAAARQIVPFGASESAGQASLVPVQVSAGSHGPFELRQIVPTDLNVQFAVQQELAEPFKPPWSQSSPTSGCTTPSPQNEVNVTETK